MAGKIKEPEMGAEKIEKELIPDNNPDRLAKAYAASAPPFGEQMGTFYMPYAGVDSVYQALGLAPEKLIIPRDYNSVVKMCYDFYQRGGIVATVISRISEFAVTEIRNGERENPETPDTQDTPQQDSLEVERNTYFEALLHSKPSRLMRFLRTASLEYYLSGMVMPRIDWQQVKGADIHPDLKPKKLYWMPVFDIYPPLLVLIEWGGWGEKKYWLKIPSSDIKLIRAGGSRIKEQQLRYNMWVTQYPGVVQQIIRGADRIEITDSDPIFRKEISYSPYPTPYMYGVLEALVFKQQLRRMDFAVASRVINAILLVTEGDDKYPLTEETRGNLDDLTAQILGRVNNPRLMERLFILFSNHTTKLQWVVPDLSTILNHDKYIEIDEDILMALGFTKILLTGEARAGQSAEVSTYAVQPMMEEFRSMALEWINDVYLEAGKRNKFTEIPAPVFRPIRLQDYIKTAAVFAQAFKEGNISRTTRTESVGADFETEIQLMRDEAEKMVGLPAFQPTPYSPLPPLLGQEYPGGPGQPMGISPTGPQNSPGRPIGSQNVPVNKRNTGVNLPGQQPTSRVQAAAEIDLMSDEELIELLDKISIEMGERSISPENVSS